MSEKPNENGVRPPLGDSRTWTPTRHWFELEWAYLQRESRQTLPLDLTNDDLTHVQLTTAHGARAWLRDRLEKARLHAHNAPAA